MVPSDNSLLKEIQHVQASLGAEIGLQKIFDYIKAEHPLWSFGIKRLRSIRKEHNLAPPPPASKRTGSEISPQSTFVVDGTEMLKIQLYFNVNYAPKDPQYHYERDIPAAYCQAGVPNSETAPFLSKLIDECEKDILGKHLRQCCACEKSATFFYGVPCVTLIDRPPTIHSITLPLCAVRSMCTQKAQVWARSATEGLQQKGPEFSVHMLG